MDVTWEGNPLRPTVSVGIAVSDGHPDFNRMLLRADGAMDAAKRDGRNRCVLGNPEAAAHHEGKGSPCPGGDAGGSLGAVPQCRERSL